MELAVRAYSLRRAEVRQRRVLTIDLGITSLDFLCNESFLELLFSHDAVAALIPHLHQIRRVLLVDLPAN